LCFGGLRLGRLVDFLTMLAILSLVTTAVPHYIRAGAGAVSRSS
jgi:hypothetical protein